MEKRVLTEFIRLYKERPCLWNTKLINYTNKNVRNAALFEMLEIYKNIDPDANLNSVRKKIDTLRSNYNRERKKVLKSYATGSSREDIYIPSLWYYEELTFLNTISDIDLEGVENIKEEKNTQSEASESHEHDTPDPVRKISARLAARKRKAEKLAERKRRKIDIDDDATNTDDEFDSFGNMAAIQLRKLEHPHQTIAMKLMSDVLFYAKMGYLNELSTISRLSQNDVNSSSPRISNSPEDNSFVFPDSPQYFPG